MKGSVENLKVDVGDMDVYFCEKYVQSIQKGENEIGEKERRSERNKGSKSLNERGRIG